MNGQCSICKAGQCPDDSSFNFYYSIIIRSNLVQSKYQLKKHIDSKQISVEKTLLIVVNTINNEKLTDQPITLDLSVISTEFCAV